MSWWSYKPYISVAEKRAKAMSQIRKLREKGQTLSPVVIEGKKIAHTFWGKAWCDNLDSYSDYDNRLPRGRSYVRNGSVIDLQITAGKITALVQGSDLYKVQIDLQPATTTSWREIQRACSGQIGSIIELLQGKLSKSVMEIITRKDNGLFPKPAEIKKNCSCYDWADVCKHVAAAMYGVGARLDQSPELLFTLRQVDHLELITKASDVAAITRSSANQKTIGNDELADVFGIDLEPTSPPQTTAPPDAPAHHRAKSNHRNKTAVRAGSPFSKRARKGTNHHGKSKKVPVADAAKPRSSRRKSTNTGR